jgi:protoheme IX farnesyltransferase
VVIGELSEPVAVSYGVALSVVSTAVLWAVGGPLAALAGAGTIAFYVFVYTGFLKRRTPQNIVIGGAAGATAPLIADAAVDGAFGWASLVLFLVIFLWTPAHFWAIALYRKQEYEAAEIPMMPSVVGEQGTRVRMLGYGVATVLVSLAFLPLGLMGALYGVAAVVLGAGFVVRLVQLLVRQDNRSARAAFMASNFYLLLLFTAMVADIALTALV